MPNPNIPDHAPAATLFPEFDGLYDLIAREVDGLTDEQLDFVSDRWGWSEWSIRMQLSHMASLTFRWMLIRWVDQLFPGGHDVDDVAGMADSPSDRRLDDTAYHDIDVIMRKLREGIDLVRSVLSSHDAGFVRSATIPYGMDGAWVLMSQAHPTGLTPAHERHLTPAHERHPTPAHERHPRESGGEGRMTLEATIRHIYFEETTHLYNIQRLKRAQGLPTIVEVPRVGYWVLPTWDRSEP